eukprot:6186274-Pleurochrysis_carterae.AAC.2
MAAAPVCAAGSPLSEKASASSHERSQGSRTCAFIRLSKLPSSVVAYGSTCCSAFRWGSSGRSLNESSRNDMVGMAAAPAHRGAHAARSALNSLMAFGPPKRASGPSAAAKVPVPVPSTKSQWPCSSTMPQLL